MKNNNVQDIIDNGYSFDMGYYISEGFKTVNKHIGEYIGFIIIYLLIAIIGSFIPFIGMFSGIILLPLSLGPAIVAKKIRNNELIQFSDFFRGYDFFGQLALFYIIQMIVILISLIPMIIFCGFSFYSMSNDESNITDLITTTNGLIFLITLIPLIYLSVGIMFGSHLIVFEKLDAWDSFKASISIIHKQWFSFFGFILVTGIIVFLGMIALGIGILYTMPVAYVSLYIAYESIVGTEDHEDESPLSKLIVR